MTYAECKTKKEKIAFVKAKLSEDPKWVVRGLIAIYEKQTADEQASNTTHHHNGVGFTGSDAEFLSKMARVAKDRDLSIKQLACVRKGMLKYAGQLVRIADEKKAV